jgi:hypothetical protein
MNLPKKNETLIKLLYHDINYILGLQGIAAAEDWSTCLTLSCDVVIQWTPW